jgi:hypothetical protein
MILVIYEIIISHLNSNWRFKVVKLEFKLAAPRDERGTGVEVRARETKRSHGGENHDALALPLSIKG